MLVAKVDGEPLPYLANGPVSTRLRDMYWETHDEGRYSTEVVYPGL